MRLTGTGTCYLGAEHAACMDQVVPLAGSGDFDRVAAA